MHYAAAGGHLNVVKFLHEKGAKLNLPNKVKKLNLLITIEKFMVSCMKAWRKLSNTLCC